MMSRGQQVKGNDMTMSDDAIKCWREFAQRVWDIAHGEAKGTRGRMSDVSFSTFRKRTHLIREAEAALVDQLEHEPNETSMNPILEQIRSISWEDACQMIFVNPDTVIANELTKRNIPYQDRPHSYLKFHRSAGPHTLGDKHNLALRGAFLYNADQVSREYQAMSVVYAEMLVNVINRALNTYMIQNRKAAA